MDAIRLTDAISARFATALRGLENLLIATVRFAVWPLGSRRTPRSICIHRVGQIGDMVCALPAIYAIRRKFPDAEITLLTSPGKRGAPGIAELAETLPWLDRMEVYYSDEVRGFSGISMLARSLQAHRFDLWVSLPQDLTNLRTELRNILFARWAGARRGIGFHVNLVGAFVRQQARALSFRRESELLFDRIRGLGIDANTLDHGIVLPAQLRESVGIRIAQAGLDDGRPLLALAPGGKRPSNRWPVSRFAAVGRRWSEAGGGVVVIGGPADTALGEEIVASCVAGSALNLCGATSIPETIAVLSRCSVAATNDSGPMHLAAAVGIPCVVAFSARDFPVKWFPAGTQHTVIRKPPACSPCLSEVCDHDNLCLQQISPDEIWTAVKDHMDRVPAAYRNERSQACAA